MSAIVSGTTISVKSVRKEINLVSWNGAEPKYDIGNWHPD